MAVPPPPENWDNPVVFQAWMSGHPDWVEKFSVCDAVIANGEGTIMGWQGRQGTQTLLFLLYAAKKHLGKKVILINHSSYPQASPYAPETAESRRVGELYAEVYRQLDFCAVRDMRSLAVLNALGCRNVRLAADCLPLYVSAHFSPAEPQGCGGYVLISGGTLMNEHWQLFCDRVLPALKQISPQIMFLFAETPKRTAADDEQLLEKIKDYNRRLFSRRIGVIRAKTAGEWLGAIHRAKFFASGRFHHSLAALSVGTPFAVLGAHSPKNCLLQDVQPAAYLPWEQIPFLRLKPLFRSLVQQGVNSTQREALCRMAMHNFDFWEC